MRPHSRYRCSEPGTFLPGKGFGAGTVDTRSPTRRSSADNNILLQIYSDFCQVPRRGECFSPISLLGLCRANITHAGQGRAAEMISEAPRSLLLGAQLLIYAHGQGICSLLLFCRAAHTAPAELRAHQKAGSAQERRASHGGKRWEAPRSLATLGEHQGGEWEGEAERERKRLTRNTDKSPSWWGSFRAKDICVPISPPEAQTSPGGPEPLAP